MSYIPRSDLNIILFRFIKEKLQPVVNSEEQLIYACHLIGPTLARFNAERPNCVVELAVCLYEMLEQVDRLQSHLKYMDPVCDLLYPFIYCLSRNRLTKCVFSLILIATGIT